MLNDKTPRSRCGRCGDAMRGSPVAGGQTREVCDSGHIQYRDHHGRVRVVYAEANDPW